MVNPTTILGFSFLLFLFSPSPALSPSLDIPDELDLSFVQNSAVMAKNNPNTALQIWKTGDYGGQCVYFVQQFLDIFQDCKLNDCDSHPFRGSAKYIVPNLEDPEIGTAVLFNTIYGHTAVVIGIYDNELELAESNYNLDERVSIGRRVPIDDPDIRGYFKF
ncbi:hypothetical protein LCGC14_2194110 [marine sediment metagenome]|uniref:Peptidase C51 domain-containing protein n=1 Tax=marine sediment metagenome TaxID=412755 RepID=A0A0F9DIT1_9ZZZZ